MAHRTGNAGVRPVTHTSTLSLTPASLSVHVEGATVLGGDKTPGSGAEPQVLRSYRGRATWYFTTVSQHCEGRKNLQSEKPTSREFSGTPSREPIVSMSQGIGIIDGSHLRYPKLIPNQIFNRRRRSMSILSPEKALIFRITHVKNVPWILANGLHCSSSGQSDPNYVQIGNPELIDRRATRDVPVPPGGTLSDYVPFYFTPYSPMLYNIKTGYNGIIRRSMDEIAILVASLRGVHNQGISFVFTDRHAYLQAAGFYDDLARLDKVDWAILQARDFRRDPDDPGKFERYQAEALIYQHLPINAIVGIIYHCEQERTKTEAACGNLGLGMQVLCKPGWYL